MSRTLSAPGLKPRLWNVSPGLVAPEWRWAFTDLKIALPLWEGGGDPRAVGVGGVTQTPSRGSSVTWTRGPEGLALEFVGNTASWIQTPRTYDWDGGPFTVLGYVSFDDLASDHAIAGSNNGGGSDWSWQCWMDTGNTNFAIATRTDGGTIQVADGGSPNTTDRFLVGISFDGTDQWNLWVDGENVGTITEGSVDPLDTVLNIGAATSKIDKNHDGLYFTAYLWSRELQSAEHRQLVRDPFGPFRLHRREAYLTTAGGTTQQISATLAGTSADSVGSIILNLTGTTTLAGTSLDGGGVSLKESITATLAGTSLDSGAISLGDLVQIAATLAGTSLDGGGVSLQESIAATLAGTSFDSATVSRLEHLAATLEGTSLDSGAITRLGGGSLGPLPNTFTTYKARGNREDLGGPRHNEGHISQRAADTIARQIAELLEDS